MEPSTIIRTVAQKLELPPHVPLVGKPTREQFLDWTRCDLIAVRGRDEVEATEVHNHSLEGTQRNNGEEESVLLLPSVVRESFFLFVLSLACLTALSSSFLPFNLVSHQSMMLPIFRSFRFFVRR